MPKTNTYHPRTAHSLSYYFAILSTMIEGLNAKLTDRELAELLNSKALLSPVGKPFTASAIKQALYRLRNHKTMPSTLHRQLLQLVFDGIMTPSEALVLFEPRNQQVM